MNNEILDFHKNNYLNSDNSIDVITVENTRKNLEEEIEGGTVLIYRITETVCNVCYDEVIKKLKEFEEKFGPENIIILIPLDRVRELKSYFENQQFEAKYYAIEPNGLGIPLESESSPFLFIYDSSLMFKHVFVPQKNDGLITSNYLDLISERYFSNDLRDV